MARPARDGWGGCRTPDPWDVCSAGWAWGEPPPVSRSGPCHPEEMRVLVPSDSAAQRFPPPRNAGPYRNIGTSLRRALPESAEGRPRCCADGDWFPPTEPPPPGTPFLRRRRGSPGARRSRCLGPLESTPRSRPDALPAHPQDPRSPDDPGSLPRSGLPPHQRPPGTRNTRPRERLGVRTAIGNRRGTGCPSVHLTDRRASHRLDFRRPSSSILTPLQGRGRLAVGPSRFSAYRRYRSSTLFTYAAQDSSGIPPAR